MTVEVTRGSEDLVGRYFVAQQRRPKGIGELGVGELEPFLRSLLFTDGTVTRALAVQLLAPVSVKPVSQEEVAVPADVAAHLETDAGQSSIRRRTAIGAGSKTLLWAESHLLPERLPDGFFGALRGAPDGIGQSLQQAALENYRELLWFGLDQLPGWASARDGVATVRRLYRLVSEGKASILISESFLVERQGGAYRLAGLDESCLDGELPGTGGGE